MGISGIGLFGQPPWIEGNIAEEQYLRRDIAWASRFARNSQLAASDSDARQGILHIRPPMVITSLVSYPYNKRLAIKEIVWDFFDSDATCHPEPKQSERLIV